MLDLFRRKKKRPAKLHFALVVADRPLDDAKFETGGDCKMFITTGEVEPHDIIPRSVLRGIVDRFEPAKAPEQSASVSDIKITEKPL